LDCAENVGLADLVPGVQLAACFVPAAKVGFADFVPGVQIEELLTPVRNVRGVGSVRVRVKGVGVMRMPETTVLVGRENDASSAVTATAKSKATDGLGILKAADRADTGTSILIPAVAAGNEKVAVSTVAGMFGLRVTLEEGSEKAAETTETMTGALVKIQPEFPPPPSVDVEPAYQLAPP
jgi:hypothetical protein